MINMKWDKYGFVIASKVRKNTLSTLGEKPCTPSQVTKKLSLDKSQITRVLHELEKEKLIICLTPHNRKGKLYKISKEGRHLMEKLKSLDS